MLLEPTTLASAFAMLSEALEKNYQLDPEPIFREAGLDSKRIAVPGARFPYARLQTVWELASEATGDPAFGLAVGEQIRPTTLHALGYAWFASATLGGALERLGRYYRVITTVPAEIDTGELNSGILRVVLDKMETPPHPAALDCFFSAVLKLCQSATDRHFVPLRVELARPDPGRLQAYVDRFSAPVTFDTGQNVMYLDPSLLDKPLPGRNAELARASERIVERYLQSLDPARVAGEVQQLLLRLLPSGKATQEEVAKRTYRSVSTLQRQLQGEGTSFRELREKTRRRLAERYLRDPGHSLGEIAFLLGFSDQSNFSRAFRRWTGMSPREFRKQQTGAGEFTADA